MPDGFVLLDKPSGVTSFSALSPLKRALGIKKVGHAGTLDKFATGLLIVLVGRGTKFVSRLSGMDKDYEALFRFGASTPTLDPESEIDRRCREPAEAEIRAVLPEYVGAISQVPPRFSAVHVAGDRAYRRALRGEDVHIPSREVRIDALELGAYREGSAELGISCSKGTYVRSIARDLGERLSSCAYVSELRRTRIGPFRDSEAVGPDAFNPKEHLLPLSELARKLPGIEIATVRGEAEKVISSGGVLSDQYFSEPPSDGDIAPTTEAGEFLALVRRAHGTYRYYFVCN
jgi:tRNA pseudouridine55 synthase